MSVSYTKPSINAETAQEVIEASVAKAVEKGGAFVIVIVDESGITKASLRMDGAPLLSVQVAQDKAYTAAGFGMSTDSWFDLLAKDEPLRLGAPTGIARLVAFGGGFPLVVDGAVIGGIGVSGGHYSDDMEVAGAGVAVLASKTA